MSLSEYLATQNISQYRISKDSGVPYTTVHDLCCGKTRIDKASAETLYKLSRVLGVSMETLYEQSVEKNFRDDFEVFKSNVCHRVNDIGDIDFIIETLEQDNIRKYYNKKWYPECLYLLAMLDYLCRINDVPICTNYDDIRNCKLKSIIYPASVIIASVASKTDKIKQESVLNSIPEFIRFNIVESEVRNVV